VTRSRLGSRAWRYAALVAAAAALSVAVVPMVAAGQRPVAASHGHDPTQPTAAETQAYMTAYNITNRIAYLLDRLSDASSREEEDALLAQVRPLLHPEVTVMSDGRVFTGREVTLEGMRVVHSQRQDHAKRLETSPTILEARLRGPSPTLTIGTVQQHWWNDVSTGQLLMANRNTELTIERVGRRWLVRRNALETVTGPIPQ
jgi:hypothetical protein